MASPTSSYNSYLPEVMNYIKSEEKIVRKYLLQMAHEAIQEVRNGNIGDMEPLLEVATLAIERACDERDPTEPAETSGMESALTQRSRGELEPTEPAETSSLESAVTQGSRAPSLLEAFRRKLEMLTVRDILLRLKEPIYA